jgi:hypothetical protein
MLMKFTSGMLELKNTRFKLHCTFLNLIVQKFHNLTGCVSQNGTIFLRTQTTPFLSLQNTSWCHLKDAFKQNPKLKLACL